jgi:transposase InsO family protein
VHICCLPLPPSGGHTTHHRWVRVEMAEGSARYEPGTGRTLWNAGRSLPPTRRRDLMLPEWLRYYNTERPHTALGFSTPAQRLADRQ